MRFSHAQDGGFAIVGGDLDDALDLLVSRAAIIEKTPGPRVRTRQRLSDPRTGPPPRWFALRSSQRMAVKPTETALGNRVCRDRRPGADWMREQMGGSVQHKAWSDIPS